MRQEHNSLNRTRKLQQREQTIRKHSWRKGFRNLIIMYDDVAISTCDNNDKHDHKHTNDDDNNNDNKYNNTSWRS